MGKKVIKVPSKFNDWKPKSKDLICEKDGKLFVCHFDKIFGHPEKTAPYNRFLIGKESYINQLEKISHYANFFVHEYDHDYELFTAYLKIKYAVDKKKIFTSENINAYIDFLHEVIFTDSMVDKIILMVNENYLDDIESGENSKKYTKSEKKHLESLEFTNQHIKILLQISFAMKIMSPCIFHYFSLNSIKVEKDSDIIYQFYKKLFSTFGHSETFMKVNLETGETEEKGISEKDANDFIDSHNIHYVKEDCSRLYFFEEEDENGKLVKKYLCQSNIDMYNKLFVYVKAKVLESNSNNSPIFQQREIFGVDVYNVVNHFTKKVLISENIVKYDFPQNWDVKLKKFKENIVGFNKTIIKFQLSYFLKEQYTKTLTEVTSSTNSEGLSGSDKLMMNTSKLDEGVITMADIDIRLTIERIKKLIDIPISDEELDFYVKNHKPSKIQILLIRSYYTRYFNSYRNLELLTRKQYMTLALILKKKLLMDLGYKIDDDGVVHYASLPYILTGNLQDKVNTRIIRNNRFLEKVKESSIYHDLMSNKYSMLENIKQDYIISLLSSIINTRFTYVTYENPDLLGTEIIYPEDVICDELLFFLSTIAA